MSIASMWAEKLERHTASFGVPKPSYRFTIDYEDLRALVDDARELSRLGEHIRGQLRDWEAKLAELNALRENIAKREAERDSVMSVLHKVMELVGELADANSPTESREAVAALRDLVRMFQSTRQS
jgi:hypothetical protein